MAPITSFLLALAGTAATVAAQGDGGGGLGSFTVSSVISRQPTGAKDGQVDYYSMAFEVNSTIARSESGYCEVSWSDNTYESQDAYSDYVPTGSWIQCDSSAANFGDGDSEFSFQLFPYFSIGNWSFQVRQTYDDGGQIVATASPYLISNTSTSYDYSCTINPEEVSSVQVHASGDCSLAANETLSVPIASAVEGPIPSTSTTAVSSTTTASSTTTTAPTTTVAASTTSSASTTKTTSATSSCTHAATVAFPVIKTTSYGQTLLVSGNITQLGTWDTSKTLALNANQYTSSHHLWDGTVAIPAGTAFEYKYLLLGTSGGVSWETGANRVYHVPSSACGGSAIAGSNPDTFRN